MDIHVPNAIGWYLSSRFSVIKVDYTSHDASLARPKTKRAKSIKTKFLYTNYIIIHDIKNNI